MLLYYLNNEDNFVNMFRSFFKVQPYIKVDANSKEAKDYYGENLGKIAQNKKTVEIKQIDFKIPAATERVKYFHNFKTLFT